MPDRSFLAAALAVSVLAGCSGGPGVPAPPAAPAAPPPYTPSAPLPGAVTVAFTLPRAGAPPPFFDLPWPTELLRRPDGRPDFRAFPGRDTIFFGAYVAAAEEDVDGYSISPTVYFHFTGPLGAVRLPSGSRAASAEDPVCLVDVDPRSPEKGTFHALEHRHYPAALRYVPADTLAVKPMAGAVLRPGTLYAAVVRRELGPAGADLGTTMDLEVLKWTSPRPDAGEEAARRLHAGAFDTLASLGAPRDRIAAVALFRTGVPHALSARLLDAATHLPPGRVARVLTAAWSEPLSNPSGRAPYHTLDGTYCTPNFQSRIDRAPYLADDGGHIAVDAAGAPRLADVPRDGTYGSGPCEGLLRARFVLTVPPGPVPPGGFPLMVSAHGTGGDAETFLGENDFAGWAARQGIAVVSTDQPLHGGRGPVPRPGSREPISISIAGIPIPLMGGGRATEAAFYNPLHPAAARDNLRQAAVDAMMLARIFTATDFAAAKGADGAPLLAAAPGRVPPRFDRDRVLAAGHSQGSQSVAVMGALDPLVRGVILSGCGGDTRLGVLRRKDLPIVSVLGMLLGFGADELDELHPFMTLVQTLADPIDPASYARLYWDPLPGRKPQSVLHYEGMTDTYAPPATAEALAVALKATHLSPVVKALPGLGGREGVLSELLGKGDPVRALIQFRSTQRENGHFVLYREPGAAELAMEFMKAMLR